MELHVEHKNKEPLLSRMSVKGNMTFESKTPTNDEVKKGIASATKADEKLVVVKGIYNSFGAKKASFSALIYDDEASMASIEPKPKKKAEAVAK
jgi:ribosomal protein S24E